jgi:hypothetical protein
MKIIKYTIIILLLKVQIKKKIRKKMTLGECFENNWLGMKYIGNNNSGERLFKRECMLNVNI